MGTVSTTNTPRKRTNFHRFMDGVYEFYFESPRAPFVLHLVALVMGLLYAEIVCLAFGRSVQSAALDAVLIAIVLCIGTPVAYSLGGLARKNSVRAKVVEKPTPQEKPQEKETERGLALQKPLGIEEKVDQILRLLQERQ